MRSRCATGGCAPQRRARRARPTPTSWRRDGQPIEAGRLAAPAATRRSASRCTPSARCSPRSRSIPTSAPSGCGARSAPTAPAASSTRGSPRSQCTGGMVGGIGMALMEQHRPRSARRPPGQRITWPTTSCRSISTSAQHRGALRRRGRPARQPARRQGPGRDRARRHGAGDRQRGLPRHRARACATCRSASRTCSNRVRPCSRPRNERMPLTRCLWPRRHCLPSENPENAPVADRTVPRLGSGGP